MLALLAPGQGSQTPGMLTAWLELPGAADRLATWSQISGLDLTRLGTTATAEEITDTAVTQPLVVAAAIKQSAIDVDPWFHSGADPAGAHNRHVVLRDKEGRIEQSIGALMALYAQNHVKEGVEVSPYDYMVHEDEPELTFEEQRMQAIKKKSG